MKTPLLRYQDGVFVFECEYYERQLPKEAGFRWHVQPCNKKDCPACAAGLGKCWFTTDDNAAAQLINYADEAAHLKLGEIAIEREKAIAASRAREADIFIPSPPGLEYYPFQKAGIAFANERSAALIADDMGLGKTLQALGLVNLNQEIKRVLVICPASLKINWQREAEKWLLPGRFNIEIAHSRLFPYYANFVIINYDILGKHRESLREKEWDILIADECFPFETFVITDKGIVEIGKVVECGIGEQVLSYNKSTNILEWKRIVRRIRNIQRSNLLKIKHENGEFKCTENHKIWIEGEGYVEAKSICIGQKLRMVRSFIPIKTRKKKVLRKQLRSKMENFYSRKERETKEDCFSNVTKQYRKETARCIPANEGIEQKSCHEEKSNKNIYEESGIRRNKIIRWKKRREWSDYKTPETVGRNFELGNRIPDPNKSGKRTFPKYSNMLQSGFSSCGKQNSHRSGREITLCEKKTPGRSTQRKSSIKSGVVSIEVLERRSYREHGYGYRKNKFVYNIEVEDNHNFFANGILVSNCHYIKNPDSQRHREIVGSAKENIPPIPTRRKLVLTGTPIENRPEEVWAIWYFLDPKNAPAYFKFMQQYYEAHRENIFVRGGKRRTVWKYGEPKNLAELQNRLRSTIMIRRKTEEVMSELPPKRRQIIELPLNGMESLVQREFEVFNTWNKARQERENARQLENESEYRERIKQLKEMEEQSLAELARIRRELALQKLPYLIEHLQEAMDSSGKVICFVYHREMVEKLQEQFGASAVHLYGGMNGDEKQEAVDRFNSDRGIKLFIASILAAGLGLNLTVSNHEVFGELDWVPGRVEQAEKRAHRIGQERPVLVQHLVFESSLDSYMAKSMVEKMEKIELALDV